MAKRERDVTPRATERRPGQIKCPFAITLGEEEEAGNTQKFEWALSRATCLMEVKTKTKWTFTLFLF